MTDDTIFLRRPKRRLRNLVVDRVDLVDSGANPGARIKLVKRQEEQNVARTMTQAKHKKYADLEAKGAEIVKATPAAVSVTKAEDPTVTALWDDFEDEAARFAGAADRTVMTSAALAKASGDFMTTPAGKRTYAVVREAVDVVRKRRADGIAALR